MWQIAGREVVMMDPVKHDKMLAAISHLPHMVAYSLVNAVADYDGCNESILKYSAGGFRDFTRIASSDPVMWRDIALQNRTALLEMMDFFAAVHGRLRTLIEAADADGLERFFESSRNHRESIL
jgi:prephenate dehydrogenase